MHLARERGASHLVEAVLLLLRLFSSTGDAVYRIGKHVGLAFLVVEASAGGLENAIHDADAVLNEFLVNGSCK